MSSLRLVRILRVIRVMGMLDQLNTLVEAFLRAMSSALWVAVLMVLTVSLLRGEPH